MIIINDYDLVTPLCCVTRELVTIFQLCFAIWCVTSLYSPFLPFPALVITIPSSEQLLNLHVWGRTYGLVFLGLLLFFNITISISIYLAASVRISFLSCGWIILCIYITFFSLLSCWWTPRLTPCLGCCEQYCDEQGVQPWLQVVALCQYWWLETLREVTQ